MLCGVCVSYCESSLKEGGMSQLVVNCTSCICYVIVYQEHVLKNVWSHVLWFCQPCVPRELYLVESASQAKSRHFLSDLSPEEVMTTA